MASLGKIGKTEGRLRGQRDRDQLGALSFQESVCKEDGLDVWVVLVLVCLPVV